MAAFAANPLIDDKFVGGNLTVMIMIIARRACALRTQVAFAADIRQIQERKSQRHGPPLLRAALGNADKRQKRSDVGFFVGHHHP